MDNNSSEIEVNTIFRQALKRLFNSCKFVFKEYVLVNLDKTRTDVIGSDKLKAIQNYVLKKF